VLAVGARRRSSSLAAAGPPLHFLLLHLWIQIPRSGNLLPRMRALSGLWALRYLLASYGFVPTEDSAKLLAIWVPFPW
jgi:hypothetical protein